MKSNTLSLAVRLEESVGAENLEEVDEDVDTAGLAELACFWTCSNELATSKNMETRQRKADNTLIATFVIPDTYQSGYLPRMQQSAKLQQLLRS